MMPAARDTYDRPTSIDLSGPPTCRQITSNFKPSSRLMTRAAAAIMFTGDDSTTACQHVWPATKPSRPLVVAGTSSGGLKTRMEVTRPGRVCVVTIINY